MSDGPDHQDIVEQGEHGERRFRHAGRLPSWRPGVTAAAVAALVIGLAAGYAAGDRHGRASAAPPTSAAPSSSPSPAVTSPPSASNGQPTFFMFADSSPLTQDTGECSTQTGQRLELGVQVTNQSPQTLTLQSAAAKLPLGGLKQVAERWAPCGALPDAVPAGNADVVLLPGTSTWLTVTFQVKVPCPAALPVQFTLGYFNASGSRGTASLPGFADLGQVPYNNCPTATGP